MPYLGYSRHFELKKKWRPFLFVPMSWMMTTLQCKVYTQCIYVRSHTCFYLVLSEWRPLSPQLEVDFLLLEDAFGRFGVSPSGRSSRTVWRAEGVAADLRPVHLLSLRPACQPRRHRLRVRPAVVRRSVRFRHARPVDHVVRVQAKQKNYKIYIIRQIVGQHKYI